jgi:hypothetical protein
MRFPRKFGDLLVIGVPGNTFNGGDPSGGGGGLLLVRIDAVNSLTSSESRKCTWVAPLVLSSALILEKAVTSSYQDIRNVPLMQQQGSTVARGQWLVCASRFDGWMDR